MRNKKCLNPNLTCGTRIWGRSLKVGSSLFVHISFALPEVNAQTEDIWRSHEFYVLQQQNSKNSVFLHVIFDTFTEWLVGMQQAWGTN